MTTKALHEIFTAKTGISSMDRHSISDMAGHFDALRQYGRDCALHFFYKLRPHHSSIVGH
jgi:hypothetical protein